MTSSFTQITTDPRHIDPNPDRLQLFSSLPNSHPQPQPLSSTSLLLLSTSAEAAVLESRRFERGSRHSSVSATASHGSPPPPTPPQAIQNPSQSHTRSATIIQSPLRRHSHHLHHHHHHQRLHHRFAETVGLQSSPANQIHHPTSTAPNHHPLAKRDSNASHHNGKSAGHLFKCEKCLKVYRHPQCLVKHRWEHTSYWADASKLMLSKHQQVQMLEAAAILAAPSGSLPESRSLWPAAVSPSEAGLLGSDQVNLDVIRSRQAGHAHSASVPCARIAEPEAEGDEEERMRDAGSEDETMFEMSLDGDDSPAPRAPPPMGFFPRRAPPPSQRQAQARVPALVAYQPFVRAAGRPVGVAYHPETIFKPLTPYAASELRFEGRGATTGEPAEEDEEVTEDEEEEDRCSSFGGREREDRDEEVIGMEL